MLISVIFSFFPFMIFLWAEPSYFPNTFVDLYFPCSFLLFELLFFNGKIIATFEPMGNCFSKHFLVILEDYYFDGHPYIFSSWLLFKFSLFFEVIFPLGISYLFFPFIILRGRKKSITLTWVCFSNDLSLYFSYCLLWRVFGQTSNSCICR